MNERLERELENAKTAGQIVDYSITLGYDFAEVTLEFPATSSPKYVDNVCSALMKNYKAFNFLKYPQQTGAVTIKFTIRIA